MKRCVLYFLMGFLFFSCARVGSPVGGERDTIPPVFLGANIDTTRINVDRNIKKLRLDFNEYIQLKDVQKSLIISPPIKKIVKILPTTLATKFVEITWEDSLQANTTYNFNFGNSIQDNNESNILRYFNFAFSTGDKIDNLYISGEVSDGSKITKVANTMSKNVVGLYKDSDSLNYKEKPYYISNADDDGYFELNYLSPGTYKILAFEDENGNSIYDEGKEKVAFQKENIVLEKNISGIPLKLFKAKKKVKYKELTEMNGGVLMTFEGNPEKIDVLSISEKLTKYKAVHQKFSDSVRVYFNADSQNIGIAQTEKLEFSYNADGKKDSVSLFYKKNEKNEMTIINNEGNLLPPLKEFRFTSNQIVDKVQPESWTLNKDSTVAIPFTARISETNPFQVLVKANFVEGDKYQLTVASKTVSSYYDSNAKPYRFDFEGDKTENYGVFSVKLSNIPSNKFWIQLLDTNENVMYSKYTNASDISFNIIKPGEYFVKILSDENENGFYDDSDFSILKDAEPVFVFYKKLNIRPLWTIEETWDLKDERKLDPSATTISKPTNLPNNEENERNKLDRSSNGFNSTNQSTKELRR
ncbi:Ig-like domain-containing protein [Frigoriflavimonas asaccharolytica]|uniref:Uncharacterized protein (DUF2141 family) n=1 Tax=Frigoriflavimonas asaccharolytica TaxID=2735899 RepID=A0A8J8G6M0_9FLAO|nr:Ig-like domain-containing protein [Frigoriflavimonas asaccharolytica]NRS92216.1 uncharacterized protein (DUF2141 family) [Frigoriflavimonas asaccharolytica]